MEIEPQLDQEERGQADAMAVATTSVIYEVIRRQGEHELERRFHALWWSGVAAGLAISTSVMAKGFLVSILPDAEWAPGISNLGYTVGFLIVILGRMQLFTENTITPILSLYLNFSRRNLMRTGRLWAIVFAANMVGCLLAAASAVHGGIFPPDQFGGILAVSRHYAEATPLEHLLWGMPAGFMIAALVWITPRLEGAGEVLMIVMLTYMIGLGGMSHVVAGSTELFILMLMGELGAAEAIFGGVAPALLGNVIGGTGLFSALTYAQVREEIVAGRS